MLFRQVCSVVTSIALLFTQTVYASGIEVDQNGGANKPTLENAQNGVPIVNIVNPNSSGLSHNKFNKYNVEQKGAILNNSQVVVKTELAGFIDRNPNLNTNAKLILNEVTGTSRSLLEGYTEVAGVAADVIVANPNGISVNGGGFINTPKATLTTGNPFFNGNNLGGFNVRGGDILIEGNGFNAGNIDKVNLYSKALQINAKIHAKDLNIVTGDNDIALDGSVTALGTNGSGLAIDSSLLGGIYADRIILASNDKGVGVHLPPEVVAQKDLTINTNGDLVLKKTAANENMAITVVGGDITSTDQVGANNIALKTNRSLIVDASSIIEANNNLIAKAGTLENSGEIRAVSDNSTLTLEVEQKILNNNNIYSKNDISLTATELENKKLIQADDDITANITNITNTIDGTIFAKDKAEIVSTDIANNGIIVADTLDITTQTITNKGALYSKNDLTIKADTLTNEEMIRSNDEINLLIANTLNNEKTGMIYADGDITIAANEAKEKINTVTNKGTIQSHKDINITAKTLNNTTTAPVYTPETTSNTKTVSRGGSNDYDIVTTTVNTEVLTVATDPALILAEGNIAIDVDTLNNYYSLISSDGDIILNALTANNVGKVAVTTTTVTTAKYRNERYCSKRRCGSCRKHSTRAGYRGTFTSKTTERIPVVNYGIQAKRSITGNVVTLNNVNNGQILLSQQEIDQKLNEISTIRTNSINLQSGVTTLDDNNEEIIAAVNQVQDMEAEVDNVTTEEEFTEFKTNLTNIKTTLEESIAKDEATISTLESMITYGKSLNGSATLSQKITELETSLTALKNNVIQNKANIETLENIDTALTSVTDLPNEKQAIIDVDINIKTILSSNTTTIKEIENNSLNTIVSELQIIHNTLDDDLQTTLNEQKNIKETVLSDQDGLYQTTNSPTLKAVNSATINTNSNNVVSKLTLPKSKFGLFTLSTNPDHNYLIEANPLYANYQTFISSDYMMGKLNYHAPDTLKRLGDAMYETTLIRNSIIALSGQRYLEGYDNDLAQFKGLMDNAVEVHEDLQLSFGVTLSKEQINGLTKDIVWMEEKVVEGQKVLVPVVYLASLDEENFKDGAQIIAGENLAVNTSETLHNQGRLEARNNLAIVSDKVQNLGGVIEAKNDATINSNTDIQNISGDIKAGNNLTLNAKNNIDIKTSTDTKTFNQRGGSQTTTVKGKAATLSADGNLVVKAGESIKVTSSEIKAGEDATLTANNGEVSIDSMEMNTDYYFNISGGYHKGRTITNVGSKVDAKNITVNAETLNLKSSNLNAKETVSLSGVEQVNVKATNDLVYQDTKRTIKGKRWGKETHQNTSYKESVVSSNIKGKNIVINSDNDVTLEAAKLKADENILIDAKNDINVIAKQYREGELHFTSKSSWGGLSKSASMDRTDALKAKEAKLQTEALNIILKSGNDIKVLGSNIQAASDLQLNATNEVLVGAVKELIKKEKWSKKSSFNLAGFIASLGTLGLVDFGPIYEMEYKLKGDIEGTAKGSSLSSGKNINIDAGSAKVIGSNLDAKENINATTDVGSIDVLSAKEEKQTYSQDKKIEVKMASLLDVTKSLHGLDGNKDTKIKITLAEASYDKVDKNSKSTLNKSSNVVSEDGNIELDSTENINIEGSNLQANNGDIALNAEQNVNIKEAVDTTQSSSKETHAEAKISATIQNEYVEAAKAVQAVAEAAKQLKQTKKDYKAYKQTLSRLESNLTTLQQELANKTPGVDKEDIDEFRELISDIKGDEKYYLAAIAAATVNLTSKTTIAMQQGQAALASSATYGFSAGVSFDVNGSKTATNSNATKAVASNLSGNNITIKTRNDLNNQTNISGSNLEAKENLTIDTKELNVVSSEDTSTTTTKEKDISGSVSMTMYGAASGPQVSLGYGQSNSENSRISNNNSQLNAKNITTKTTEDTNIKGANVNASELLSMIVGGDLNVESQKDTYNAYQKGFNVSAGFGLGDDPNYSSDDPNMQKALNKKVGLRKGNGEIASANAGFGASNGRTKVKETVLTSLTGKEVDIQVDKNTNLKGSLVAAGEYDKNGNFKDNKNLNLTTDTLTYQNSTNRVYDSSKSFNVGVGLGFGEKVDEKIKEKKDTTTLTTANLSYNNSNTYSKSKTLATLGEGNVTIKDKENSDDTTVLNRDVTKTNKDIYSAKTDVKADMTLDGRLLSEEGQKQIKEDYIKTTFITTALLEAATTESTGLVGDQASGVTGIFQNIEDKVALFDGTKKFVNDPKNKNARDILLNPNATPQEIKQAQHQLHVYVAKEMGITPAELVIILDKQYKGFTSSEDGKARVAANLHKTMGDMSNTTLNETSDVADLQRDKGIEKTDNYVKNRDEYSKNFGDLGQDLLDNQYSQTTGHSINNTTYNQKGTDLSKPSELDNTVITNTREFNKLDKSQGAHRQLSNNEIKFLQSEEKVRAYLLSKDNNSNPSQEDIQGARHELTQTAIALVDNNWARVLGEINPDAKSFLETNVESIKNVTELDKENSFKNTTVAMDNLNFYKEYIHPAIQKNLETALKDEIKDKATQYKKSFEKIKEQGVEKTLEIAKNKLGNYYDENTFLDMLKDGGSVLKSIIEDTAGSIEKASYNLTTNPQDLAKIYNITTEEATAVQAVLVAAAANEFGVSKTKTASGVLDLGVEKKDLQSPYNPKTAREDLEVANGSENVTSTTIPKQTPRQTVNSKDNVEVITDSYGNKAVITTYNDPLTGETTKANIPYNTRGLPVFDDVSKFTTTINKDVGYQTQMKHATKDLNKYLNENPAYKNNFTAIQLEDIAAGDYKIEGYTWHHNADSNNMQLVPEEVHKNTLHVGENTMKKGN